MTQDLEDNIRKLIILHRAMERALLRILFFAQMVDKGDGIRYHPSDLTLTEWARMQMRKWSAQDGADKFTLDC